MTMLISGEYFLFQKIFLHLVVTTRLAAVRYPTEMRPPRLGLRRSPENRPFPLRIVSILHHFWGGNVVSFREGRFSCKGFHGVFFPISFRRGTGIPCLIMQPNPRWGFLEVIFPWISSSAFSLFVTLHSCCKPSQCVAVRPIAVRIRLFQDKDLCVLGVSCWCLGFPFRSTCGSAPFSVPFCCSYAGDQKKI